ncbi:MAG: hypothetical protein WD534_14575 [Phycisphaeraceae bacterium]
MKRLQDLRYRAAIVGPEGSGKTTLLRQLGGRLEQDGYRTHWFALSRDRRHLSQEAIARLRGSFDAGDIILFDGAGHLNAARWWAFRRRVRLAAGVVITAHGGQRLPLLLHTRTDPALLESLIAELLADASSAALPHAAAQVDPAALLHRHGGNVRDALREMYDHCA